MFYNTKREAIFTVLYFTDKLMLIKDLWSIEENRLTVTNDVENVVKILYKNYKLTNKHKLYFIDTDDTIDEIIHENGNFKHFKIHSIKMKKDIKIIYEQLRGL